MTTSATTASYKKRLEGVTSTPDLLELYDHCYAWCKKSHQKNDDGNNNGQPLLTRVSTEESSSSPARHGDHATSDSDNSTASLLRPLSLQEAQQTIMDFQAVQNKKGKKPKYLPIVIIKSMKIILLQINNNNHATAQKLQGALSASQLYFTPAPTPSKQFAALTQDQQKFRQRMERLRLQNEETNYYKLTKNIGNAPVSDDAITTRSMTYAASVGLNMIVAPLSFGIFMYFFSGPILGFVWSNFEPAAHSQVDIRQVIIGVISGVAMLFIEMILFVIRTHELESALQKKQKKKQHKSKVQPFGAYSSASEKTYQD